MRLKSFRIQNYRSIDDSGWVDIEDITALVGRNESGKTNLLLALASLKPNQTEHIEPLNMVKDFPNDRPLSEFSEHTEVVETKWKLTDSERSLLETMFPRAKSVQIVSVNRPYSAARTVGFENLPSLQVDQIQMKDAAQNLKLSFRQRIAGFDDIRNELDNLIQQLVNFDLSPPVWANHVAEVLKSFIELLQTNNIQPTPRGEEIVASIDSYSDSVIKDDQNHSRARSWIVSRMPNFIYLDEYPELEGHQHLANYVERKSQNRQTAADRNFEKLMKVAELDVSELRRTLHEQHEVRQQLTNRAGAVVSRKLKELWTDTTLKLRFSLDEDHFDTLISDPNADYDVEINLNERSRGFKWFFSFYINFAADTLGGDAKNAILLLDEPGLFLHALGQRDLLNHFENDFDNQIIYTTHSPFMIKEISRVRTVLIDKASKTTVSNEPMGDRKTLFPLQTALGYDLAQSLFIDEYNLVVEGVTDYWYLSAMSDYHQEINKSALPPELIMTPAGGASKVPYMVSLLSSQSLKVLVLLDHEQEGKQAADDAIKGKLVRQDYVTFVTDSFPDPKPNEADIEDLLDKSIFDNLVYEAYAKELAGKSLSVNPHIPRIVKRYEEALNDIGVEFHKTRIAKLFLKKVASNPASVVTTETSERFARLFETIQQKVELLKKRNYKPFI